MTAEILSFETGRPAELAEGEPALVVDVEGYEGPLDLLLALARQQKVDLAKISILALADQFLAYVEAARAVRLELAADYLVMAAWLAYLKSRLLLPAPPSGPEPDAGLLAQALADRLRRLEAIREAARKLAERPRLGRDFFARGMPEPVAVERKTRYEARVYDLLAAYAQQRQRHALARVRMAPRAVWSLAEARGALERLLGMAVDWMSLDDWLSRYAQGPEQRRTARASTFSASLELVREGKISLRQSAAFAPIYVRAGVVAPET
ncbi:MAG: segregation/condensation protein A [Hyphomicrobiales bacterium]|nr:segregation/condensation protein A [Hyphomicrobiales bacterium]